MTERNRDEIREFLTTRRAKVRPDQVDLEPGANRRVPGLRRSEVALLADVSVEYYSRLERGDLAGASDAVLHGIASALLLDEAEREHLFDLARAVAASPARRQRRSPRNPVVRPGLQLTLDAITGGPALVRNGRMDIIAANTLGRALHADAYFSPERPVNLARHAFLDRKKAELFYPDWDATADAIGAITNVRRHATGVKHFHHPIVGTLDLLFEASELMADRGWSLLIYTAEPGTPAADALRLLASWAATQEQEHALTPTESTTPHEVLNPGRSD